MDFAFSKKTLCLILAIQIIGTYNLLDAQINFSDISSSSGFDNSGVNRGLAVGDFDNDGDDDIYVSRLGEPNLLFRNNNGTFTNVAASYGVDYSGATNTSVWGDFDNDGRLDLYLGNKDAPNILFHNNGNGSFSNIAFTAEVDAFEKPRAVLVADVDRDGYLDIYVANLLGENALYRNNGNLTFTNIVAESGASDPQLSMGAMFFDYDNDGDSDLYLTHDGNQPNILYQNDGAGNFTDVSVASGTNYAGFGMGVDFGDINNDGWLDIYITNLSSNTLFLNNGDGTFTNISTSAKITDPGMGWGTTFLDFDNDGLQDIYMVNDSYFSPLPNILYRNMGDNTFDIVSENSPVASLFGSYGTACTDINKDGLLDIFVANSGSDNNQLFRNETNNPGNWFQLKLKGTISNRAAVGTKVTIEADGQLFTDEVSGGSGYASQNSFTLHFGLGNAQMIDQMTIRWTNGLIETYQNLSVNQTLLAVENESLTTGLLNPETSGFKIETFPNPISEELNIIIESDKAQDIQIYISNIVGKKQDQLFSGRVAEGEQIINWYPNRQQLTPGIYLLTIASKQFTTTKKVVVEK
jgi:enediyne biosynthesis protein E4